MTTSPSFDFELSSLADLEKIIDQLDTGKGDQFWDFDEVLWYRGQTQDYPLRPGFLRDSVSQARFGDDYDDNPEYRDNGILGFERQFNQTVKRRAASFLDPKLTLTELYFQLQHHGLPTRLLDWSENALAAVFFSVNGNYDKDGFIYVIDPSDLLAKQNVIRGPLQMQCENMAVAIEDVFYHEYERRPPEERDELKETEKKLVPVLADLIPGRMLQQASCFTLHAVGSPSIETIPNFKIHRCCIPAKCKQPLQRKLRRLGIDYASIYHDLDNLGKEVKEILFNKDVT